MTRAFSELWTLPVQLRGATSLLLNRKIRHSRVGGNPECILRAAAAWIPAYAGMTRWGGSLALRQTTENIPQLLFLNRISSDIDLAEIQHSRL